MALNISKASAIPGWMSDTELEWLAEQAQSHNLIVEIGSHLGRSTRALGDYVKGKVLAIDNFNAMGIEYNTQGGYFTEEERGSIFQTFSDNLSDLIENGKVVPIKISYDEVEGSPYLNTLQPDFTFIDGDHSYEAVYRDIKFWKSKMLSPGLICGHDANYEPVSRAVHALLGRLDTAEGTTIWYATV